MSEKEVFSTQFTRFICKYFDLCQMLSVFSHLVCFHHYNYGIRHAKSLLKIKKKIVWIHVIFETRRFSMESHCFFLMLLVLFEYIILANKNRIACLTSLGVFTCLACCGCLVHIIAFVLQARRINASIVVTNQNSWLCTVDIPAASSFIDGSQQTTFSLYNRFHTITTFSKLFCCTVVERLLLFKCKIGKYKIEFLN